MVFNATFNNIVAVSFIGGGNRSWRIPLTCCISHNCCIENPSPEWDTNSQC